MTFSYDRPAEEIKSLLEEKIDVRMEGDNLSRSVDIPSGGALFGRVDGEDIRLTRVQWLLFGSNNIRRVFFGRITDGADGAVITGRFRVPARDCIIYFVLAALIVLFAQLRGYGPPSLVGAVYLMGLFAAFWILLYLSSRFLHRKEERYVVELLKSLGDE